MFREGVLAVLGMGDAESGCDERQRRKCRFEFGDFYEWTCERCERVKG